MILNDSDDSDDNDKEEIGVPESKEEEPDSEQFISEHPVYLDKYTHEIFPGDGIDLRIDGFVYQVEVPSRSDWKKDVSGNFTHFIYYHKRKAPIIDKEMKYEIDLDNWRKESEKITKDYFFDDTSGVMINIGITPSTIHNLAEGNENPHYDGNDEGKWRDDKLLSNKDDSGRISPTNIQSGQTKIPGQENVTHKWEKLKIKDENTKEKDVNIVEDSESSDEEDANIQKDNIYPKKFMYEGKYAALARNAALARKWAKEKALPAAADGLGRHFYHRVPDHQEHVGTDGRRPPPTAERRPRHAREEKAKIEEALELEKMKKQKMLIKMAKESKKAWEQKPKEGPDAANARKKAMQKYAIKQKKREKILQAKNDARAEMEERLNERLRNLNIK